MNKPEDRLAGALLGREPQQRCYVLADAVQAPGTVYGPQDDTPRFPDLGRRRQGAELAVAGGRRDDGGEPDPAAVNLDDADPNRELLIRVLGISEPADRLVAGQITVGQRLKAELGGLP